MRRIAVCLAALAALTLVTAPGAQAASTGLALCSGTWKVSFSPGVGLAPGSSDFTTKGPTGMVLCVGTVDGHAVTGAGSFAKEGVVEGSCVEGEGSGMITVKVPTTDGLKVVEFPFTMATGPGLGFKFGESLFGPLTFAFVPSRGSCVLTPVTEIIVVGEFALRT
jgi:hypothetical protein